MNFIKSILFIAWFMGGVSMMVLSLTDQIENPWLIVLSGAIMGGWLSWLWDRTK